MNATIINTHRVQLDDTFAQTADLHAEKPSDLTCWTGKAYVWDVRLAFLRENFTHVLVHALTEWYIWQLA